MSWLSEAHLEHGRWWQQVAEHRTWWALAAVVWWSRWVGMPYQGRAPVAVMRASLCWLLNIFCSCTPRSCPALAPGASAGPNHTHCWCWSHRWHLLPVPSTSHDCSWGFLHLPLLLRSNQGSSHSSHPLTVPALIAPDAGTSPNLSMPSAAVSRAGAVSLLERQQLEGAAGRQGTGTAGLGCEDGPRLTLVPTADMQSIVHFKVHECVHWAPSCNIINTLFWPLRIHIELTGCFDFKQIELRLFCKVTIMLCYVL